MTRVSFASAWRKSLHRFADNRAGVSAVEFALILPLMVTLYAGGVAVTQAVSADRKTMAAAYTVANLVSQAPLSSSGNQCLSSGNSDISDLFSVANEVIYPFVASNLTATVTTVNIDTTTGKATVDWSAPTGTTPYSHNQDVTNKIPQALRQPGQAAYLIWGQASYAYTPPIGEKILGGPLTLTEQVFLAPRQTSTVTLQTASCS